MHIKLILTGLLGLLLSAPVFSQDKSISVSNYTGSLNVAVPLYNVTSGSLSLPVTAVYQTNGVKVKDIKTELGMNWHLVAGGEISRQVRGLPDDVKKDNLSNARLGWLYNTNGAKINAFTIANDNSTVVCTDETADNNYITTNFSDLSDTEPDIFNINAPGLSCQFVFNNGHVIKTIPYQDLKITYDTDPTTGAVLAFTVVNDKGVTYTFGATGPDAALMIEKETRKAINPGTVSYFKRAYDQYLNGITFNRAWKLNGMTSIAGGGIFVNYKAGVKKVYSTPVSVVMPGASSATNQYAISTNFTPLLIDRVFVGNYDDIRTFTLEFHKAGNTYSYIEGMGRTASFGYQGLTATGTDRAFLKSIYLSGGGAKRTFNFGYSGLTYDVVDVNTGNITTPASLTLPDSTSKEIDYWGYYNASSATSLVPQIYINPANTAIERYRNVAPGSSASSYAYTISGTSRDAALSGAINGSLNRITSDLGDTTTVEYELNSFYDNTAGAVVQGGGIRVKKITASDGITASNNIVANYSYLIPSTGVSSGKAISMPAYAFTTPYTGSGTVAAKWASSTIRSEDDLSNEDESIVYNFVKVSRTGTGNILYEYAVPATSWDSSALPDWTLTTVYSGRVSCGTATFASNQANNYPYPQNPNFDFERGLVKKISTFNEAGQQTSEESYTYQRSYATPTIITGFKFDNNTSSARNYAKYSIYAGTSELIAQQTKKVFDLPALTSFQTGTTTYNYAGTAHKLLTSTEATNSDGSITRSYIKYVKDYNTTLGTDSMANALYRLKQKNINVPIEQYQQVQRGMNTVTTSAGLTLYKYFDAFSSTEKPSQSLQFVSPAGVTDFQPSGITSNTFTRDSRYVVRSNYLAYDALGVPQSVDDNRHNVMTTFTDFSNNRPFVAIKNAMAKEVAFNSFDNAYLKPGFTYTDTTRSLNDRNGFAAVTIKPTSIIRDTITKSGLANNYIFSIWVNTTAAGSIAVQVTDGTLTNNVSLVVPNTAGKWQYQETRVPVANLNATFTVKLTPNANTLVDDVLFYPENAQVGTTAYNVALAKASETNSNGVSVYYNYDEHGRLKFVYDQDKNIVKKNTYVAKGSASDFGAPAISIYDADNYNNPVYFSVGNYYSEPNVTKDGLVYTWDFGDGSAPVITTKNYLYHTYTHAGAFTVTLTKSSPIYGTKTSSDTVTMAASSSYRNTLVGASGVTGGDVVDCSIYQNGVLLYYFTMSQINAGTATVRQGIYDVTVRVNGTLYNPTTHSGYKSVMVTPSPPYTCRLYQTGTGSTTDYQFPHIDLNGKTLVSFITNTEACAPPED